MSTPKPGAGSRRSPGRRGGAWTRLPFLAALTVAVLAGCADDAPQDPADQPEDQTSQPADPLSQAEAAVERAQQALEEAEAEFDGLAEAFCGASSDYVRAIDRYGDVLTASAPTVGDVKVAGSDLVDPREEAVSSAEAAVAAHEAVLAAEEDLAEAQTALEEAGGPSATAMAGSPEQLVPAATLSRVTQAESEFESAAAGLTDETPLAQASEDFNAAAVALELSWLRLFADAGCLTDDQAVQAQATVAEYTATLQEALAETGYYEAEVDGIYGPATVDAVRGLQETHELPVTGTVDSATEAALRAELEELEEAAADRELASTAALQQTLVLAGYWDGPVDGQWTEELTQALTDLQTDLGVEPTGEVDAATVAALEKAIAELGEAQTGTSSPSPSSSPTEDTGATATESPSG